MDSPLYIRGHSKSVLTQAITNDTHFLSANLVMDYSLLVGVDETRKELIIGIIGELLFIMYLVVVVVCPLQPSSSVNSGCPGPESSILVSSRWACPISSQVTDHWGELRNRTDEVHPVDPFHSLDILKNHSASVAFCRNLGVYNVQNGAVIELSFVVSVKGFPRH